LILINILFSNANLSRYVPLNRWYDFSWH